MFCDGIESFCKIFFVLIDAKAVSSVRDGKSRQELIAEMEALCEAARRVCLLTASDDHDVSKLISIRNKNGQRNGP